MSEVKTEIVSIENITGSQLVNVNEWKEKIQKVKEENPVIEITDNATYEAEKKARTAVKSVRVEIDKQDSVIASAFSKARKETMEIRDSLLGEITPFEKEHQAEVEKWEKKKENERIEKERIEAERVDGIKNKIAEIETEAFTIIQKMTFETFESDCSKIAPLVNSEFDFEEYDILYTQAAERIKNAAKDKLSDINEKEAQRLENDRLEEENKVRREREELQNARLSKIAQYIPFTTDLNVIELHVYSEDEFTSIYKTAKDRKEESDRAESERQRDEEMALDERERKEQEEKEAIYNVRKDRLIEMGFVFDTGTYHFRFDRVTSIPKVDVFTMNAVVFENFINEAKAGIKKVEEEKIQQIRFNERVSELTSYGLKSYGNHLIDDLSYMSYESIMPISVFNIKTMDENEWTEWLKVLHLAIKEYHDDLRAKDKEQQARNKALAGDKKKITEYIDTLDFRGDVPEFKNKECDKFLAFIDEKLSAFKNELLIDLKNL